MEYVFRCIVEFITWEVVHFAVEYIRCNKRNAVLLCLLNDVSLLLFLLQSALQPLWVLACSTIAEHSQQEGFDRVPLPAARQTPNLDDQ